MFIFLIIFAIIADFFLTAFLFWLLTLALGIFGIVLTFTWAKALAFWAICCIIKTLFSKTNSQN